MKKPAAHPQEEQRLQALKDLQILDTLPEDDFDQITKLAAHICGTSIAVVSLVDEHRQWFKSKVGLGAEETSRDVSFCGHAILGDEIFVIENAKKDERFSDNPLVTGDPNISFYAGVPVKDSTSDLPMGTLCVIDSEPKKLSTEQTLSLHVLANQVELILKLRATIRDLNMKNLELQFHEQTYQSLREGIVIQNSSGAIVEANYAAAEILCMSGDQLIGKTSMDPDWYSIRENGEAFPGQEHPAMICLKTGQVQKGVIMGVGNKNNSRWISINVAPIVGEKNQITHVVSTFTDITKIKESQAQLVQKARLASVGELAAGIAHEINNPLAIISGTATQLKKAIDKDPIDKEKIQKLAANINSTIERIAQIVKGLLKFARDGENDPLEPISVNDVLEDVVTLAKERIKNKSIDLKIEVPQVLSVKANATYLAQIIVNLLNNSVDAVEGLSEKWISIKAETQTQTVTIFFSDSGSGISPEIGLKIFEPFFTTKQVGQGTGMGLSISKGLIEKMGGSIELLKSEKNTTFKISLPKA
jgi:PAS domain S-box-containing protein